MFSQILTDPVSDVTRQTWCPPQTHVFTHKHTHWGNWEVNQHLPPSPATSHSRLNGHAVSVQLGTCKYSYLLKHLYDFLLLLRVLLGHKCPQNKQNSLGPPGGSPGSDFKKTTRIKHKLAHLFTLSGIKQDYSGNIKKNTHIQVHMLSSSESSSSSRES